MKRICDICSRELSRNERWLVFKLPPKDKFGVVWRCPDCGRKKLAAENGHFSWPFIIIAGILALSLSQGILIVLTSSNNADSNFGLSIILLTALLGSALLIMKFKMVRKSEKTENKKSV